MRRRARGGPRGAPRGAAVQLGESVLNRTTRALGWLLLTTAFAGGLAPAARAAGLDKAFIRSTHPHLDDAAFERKWRESVANPVMFIRAFPAAFHRAAAALPAPGKEALCLGDAHPGNFGFLNLGGRAQFAYNDLDDSGYCRAAIDAVRYFTAVQMFFGDAKLSKDLVERYVDVLKDASRAEQVKNKHWPDWREVRAKGLAKYTRGAQLAGDSLSAASARDATAVAQLLARTKPYKGARVLHVAAVARDAGGSGGLRRYWALVEQGAARTIVELKEATTPGTEWGVSSKRLPFASRLATLKAAIWGTRDTNDYFYVGWGRAWFLVRDRFTKKSLDVLELGAGDRKDVMQAQVSHMALLHTRALRAVKKDELRAWLLAHAQRQAAMWMAAYRARR